MLITETFENTILRSVRVIFDVKETLDNYFSKFQHIEIQDPLSISALNGLIYGIGALVLILAIDGLRRK